MHRETISRKAMWGLLFVVTAMQQLHAMDSSSLHVSRQKSERKTMMDILHKTTPLSTAVCHEVINYLSHGTWKLSGTCDVGFSYHGPHDFTSRRVVLTDNGLVYSRGALIAYHNHKGNFRKLLKSGKTFPGKVSHLASSRTLPDGSSYVAATAQQMIPESPFHNNHLSIWHMKPGETETAPPTTFELETHHTEECDHSETVDSLVFSSDRGVTYLAAASPKTITLFRRDKVTRAFALYLLLPSQNGTLILSPPINLSFPEKDRLVSLYGNTMKHWKLTAEDTLTTDFGEHITSNLNFFPTEVVYLVECYAYALAHTTEFDTYSLRYNNPLLMEPTGYKIARFDLSGDRNTSVELLSYEMALPSCKSSCLWT